MLSHRLELRHLAAQPPSCFCLWPHFSPCGTESPCVRNAVRLTACPAGPVLRWCASAGKKPSSLSLPSGAPSTFLPSFIMGQPSSALQPGCASWRVLGNSLLTLRLTGIKWCDWF